MKYLLVAVVVSIVQHLLYLHTQNNKELDTTNDVELIDNTPSQISVLRGALLNKDKKIEELSNINKKLNYEVNANKQIVKGLEGKLGILRRYNTVNKILEVNTFKQTLPTLSWISEANEIKEDIADLMKKSIHITPKQLKDLYRDKGVSDFEMLNSQYGTQGVYVVHNKTKNIYYIGSSDDVVFKVYESFSKRGNYDLYTDYTNNDELVIRIVYLNMSLYGNVIELKEDITEYYNKLNGYIGFS